MKILIVEDDSFKYSKIQELINESENSFDIVKCENVHDTVIYLNKETPDKIILDMSLPSHAARIGEGNPLSMPSGGIEIIFELISLSKLHVPVVILTQYPEIEIENEYYSIEKAGSVLMKLYDLKSLSAVLYEHDNEAWKYEVVKYLRQ
jgi:DNA-binding NarL/FixJ family response regulator